MDASFRVIADPASDLLSIFMGGFFSLSDVAAFGAAMRREIARLRCPPNARVTLCDLREMKIQSQDVVAAFSALVADPAHQSRRLAFVVGTTLARMQAQRLSDRPNIAFFKTVDEARHWLFESDDAPAAATAAR